MAKKISQFTEATEIKSGDISVVVQDGETKQFPLDLLATKEQADEYKTGVETQLADYEQEITDIKNQYDKELYTPTITVTNTSMVKTGQGDTVDYSASVEDSIAKSAILKGCTGYRDIDTGDILDTFDETKNLELVSVKTPVLTTSNEDGTETNILTVNEDVELRGIGDVRDELDLLTGEVTERIGCEYFKTLNWNKYTYNESERVGYTQFIGQLPLLPETTKALFDMLPTLNYISDDTKSNGMLFEAKWNTTRFRVSISNDLLSTTDVDGLLKLIGDSVYLITKDKESIKTVVLNPSGTLASETPYMWKNGSIQLSSDGLVPGLDYAVTTSRVGVIETNMQETIANEKRIHTLEVMLAQSTITAATDAVSLQSDLETITTTIDGAQLDTGNTQDDFLYEMILLLIEKDAYDESLFDKVCVFYLYGKLSDEQFTNIYSLLYPEEE